MASSSASQPTGSGTSLDDILTALQQGVQAINNLAQAMTSSTVPST